MLEMARSKRGRGGVIPTSVSLIVAVALVQGGLPTAGIAAAPAPSTDGAGAETVLFTLRPDLEPARKVMLAAASWDITLSGDMSRLAVKTRRGGKKGPRVLVVDGVESADYEEIGPVLFSPDGSRLAYGAKRGGWRMVLSDAGSKKRWARVLLDGREGNTYDAVLVQSLRFEDEGITPTCRGPIEPSIGFGSRT